MAEEVKKKSTTKKSTTTAKPKTPKPKKTVETVAEEQIEIAPATEPLFEEVPDKEIEVAVPETSEVEETPVIEVPKEEPKPVELPEGAETFEEFHKAFENSPVEIKKLNPNLPDTRSKWIAYIPTKTGRHILFKGSYARAYRAAENWNISRGLAKNVKEIRSK